MPDFWPSCGYRLLAVGADGRLTLRDDFLRAHLLRPELAPIAESDAAELALHESLLRDPRRSVRDADLAALGDADARENYAVWLRFRARLLAAPSIEAAYVGLFQGAGVDVAPLFVHQLTQVMLRHILGADAEPLEARAAEMLFRAQKITLVEDGFVLETEALVRATEAGYRLISVPIRSVYPPGRQSRFHAVADGARIAWYLARVSASGGETPGVVRTAAVAQGARVAEEV